jgi:peptidoglycan/xylan/chitin deacetylase (PgdA/CDA1 family)
MRRLFFTALRASLIPLLLRRFLQPGRVTVLLYHDPSPAVMERHLTLIERQYRPITLAEFLAARAGRLRLPERALLLTLDDGHAGNAKLLPIFKGRGIRPVVFLCSGLVGTRRHFWWHESPNQATTDRLKLVPDAERLHVLHQATGYTETREYDTADALSDSDVEALKAVADIGAHTIFHPGLPQCDDERASTEIRQSKQDLQDRFGVDVRAFAYPNGDYTKRDAKLAAAAGYECAFKVGTGLARLDGDPYRLPRVWVSDRASDSELLVELSGLWSWLDPRLQWLRGLTRKARGLRNPRRGNAGARAGVTLRPPGEGA